MKKKSTKKPTRKNYKSYEKIISIQERIIKIKENEHQMVFKLFQHYLDKSIEGWDWYARYWSDYNRLIKIIKHFEKVSEHSSKPIILRKVVLPEPEGPTIATLVFCINLKFRFLIISIFKLFSLE